MKEHIYSTDEYEVKIGDPVVDAEVKATSTSVAIPCAAIPDGKYLVSLEVNGTAVAFRDTFSFASGSCTVGDYTLAYSSYAVTVSTTSNNDVVRLKIEPVEVYVTDAMKAAVVEVSPPSPAELPAITDADNGKVLTVQSVTEKGAVIVPEQTPNEDNELTGDPTLFVEGAAVILAVNGTEYLTTVEASTLGVQKLIATAGDDGRVEYTEENGFKAVFSGIDHVVVSINLASNSGVWGAQEPIGKKFIVTLTPTAQDFSGTMDKTVAEINAAYGAGRDIWFFFEISGTGSFEFKCDTVGRAPGDDYPSFNGGMYYGNTMVRVNTMTTNDGTKQTYSTNSYTLTPAT